MIGVIADAAEHESVREFFELFKTSWEFCRKGRFYPVVLCAGAGAAGQFAGCVLVYAGRRTEFDDAQNVQTGCEKDTPHMLVHLRNRIPIYGSSITFPERSNSLLSDGESGECAAYLERSGSRLLARIGYDLFGEIRALLTEGQPAANAHMPTLDLHIAFLRELITACGIGLTEIPSVPEGYRFIACLTHDVDHPSIRRHNWDHTTLGFLHRAVFGSVRDALCGRMWLRDVLKNWAAALKLPFIHLGLAKDFWRDFGSRYLAIENGLPSTYFVIPFANRPGNKSDQAPAPAFRAARYGAKDIEDTLRQVTASGCEVSLHGIDAWLDAAKGREELEEVRRVAGQAQSGVRMHWLYFGAQSPATLEAAGADYDSTVGYNGAVGYRAGTTQVYKPLQTERLLELPLHVMDTALFYPSHMGLSREEADRILDRLIDNAAEYGGCLTINWHDRSLAPERQWDRCYRDLIDRLKERGAWFATAGQAVEWFRMRRAATFEEGRGLAATRVKLADGFDGRLPALRIERREAGKEYEISLEGTESYNGSAAAETEAAGVNDEAGI